MLILERDGTITACVSRPRNATAIRVGAILSQASSVIVEQVDGRWGPIDPSELSDRPLTAATRLPPRDLDGVDPR